jgi:hypothetical protein
MDRYKALGVTRRLEAAHPPLALAGGLVGVLRPIIEPLMLTVVGGISSRFLAL